MQFNKLDEAQFSFVHIKACLVSGIGFFTDAYDLFVISLAIQMIKYQHPDAANYEGLIKLSALIGTLFGQIIFGYFADQYGRKRMYGIELIIIVLATIAQSLSYDIGPISFIFQLVIWRFIMGFGIGGDYPLSAIITSEFANVRNRGAMMAAVFAMQGFGILAASIVSLIFTVIYKQEIIENNNFDSVWRWIIGFGAIPGTFAIYYRLTIPESPRFTSQINNQIDLATNDINNFLQGQQNQEKIQYKQVNLKLGVEEFYRYISQWKSLKLLLGTALSWFALDIAFYGTNLNNPIIYEAVGLTNSSNPYESVKNTAIGNIVIALMGTVPGYWFTVYYIDNWGRKYIQLMGFTALTIIYLILGFFFDSILKNFLIGFIFLFILANFFTNFGPNSTTFIIPGELFPTKYRSTCHGISAASGKLGAIISQYGFITLKDVGGKNNQIPNLLLLFSFFMLIGLLFTLLIPETNSKSLEQLEEQLIEMHKIEDDRKT